jgi:hypothetical protein
MVYEIKAAWKRGDLNWRDPNTKAKSGLDANAGRRGNPNPRSGSRCRVVARHGLLSNTSRQFGPASVIYKLEGAPIDNLDKSDVFRL